MTERKGVTEQMAKIEMRRRLTLIGAMLLHKGEVDGLICGTWGHTALHLHYIDQVIGKRAGVTTRTCLHERPDAAGPPGVPGGHPRQLRPHGRAAGRNHRHGGRGNDALWHQAQGGAAVALQLRLQQPAQRRQDAPDAGAAAQQAPWLEVDGEMHGDVALDGKARAR
jgi:malate dehydrogenase (oxaloacetate-decarboxylating)(NADP+)